MKHIVSAVFVLVAVMTASAQVPPPATQQPPQQPPVFRGGTDVVPLTITVVDQKGAPVKDLKASDFTITENKKVREILAFFPQELAPGPVPTGEIRQARVSERTSGGVTPQTRRTFLIVLGYGRIEYPTRALEGAIELVNRLLPQDVVAVMGFHRTTEFTTDHKRIADILERYRKAHEDIVGEIDNYRFMSRSPYGGSGGAPIPDKFLKRIDEIFLGPSVAGGSAAASAFVRNTSDLLLGMDRLVPVVEKPGQYQETFSSITKILRDHGEPVNDEVLLSTKLKFYAGVEYLRGFDGDKQMVFFSGLSGGGTLGGSAYRPTGRGGTTLKAGNTDSRVGARIEIANAANGVSTGGVARDADEAEVLAQRASDARVVVNLIATNGTGRRSSGDPAGRDVAELTGGYYTSLETASKAVAKVDELTRFSYLVGYAPSDPKLDGKFRDIEVSVNRPGATVRYRHGYFAAPEPPPVEIEKLVKKARIETALSYDQEATDISLQVTVAQLPRMGLEMQSRVEIIIDAAPLAFELKDGVRSASVEVQVYCGDAKENSIGEAGQRLDLTADEATYQQWLKDGIRRVIRVGTTDPPKYVKVVVYDYGSDRVGSKMVTIK